VGTRRVALLLALGALATAGCGGEGDDPVDGTGYTYSVPDGWEDLSERAEDEPAVPPAGLRPDSVVAGERRDDFASNVNVVRERGLPDGITTRAYAEASIAAMRDPAAAGLPPEITRRLESLRVTGIGEPREAELDGEDAREWEYGTTWNGRPVRVRQVAVVVGNAGYTVTLTVLPARFGEGAAALGEVVESWRWE
jgi:hypothetical protein